MLNNNKGFTVIELIMSFAFVALLSASLFAVVVNYKEKQQSVSIETELLSFKTKLTIDIQSDIQTKILEDISYCTTVNDKGVTVRVNRCLNLKFKNGETKTLEVKTKSEMEPVLNADGTTTSYPVSKPYIAYGGIMYMPPDAANISIENDYTLEYTTPTDGIENNLSLYKIRIGIRHSDIDGDMDISIVASGNRNANADADVEYGAYEIGDRVQIQLGGYQQAWFRVIKDSGNYENKLILLLENNLSVSGSGLTYSNTGTAVTYAPIDFGNSYESSTIATTLEEVASKYWPNPDVVRLISAEEVGYLVYACPKYQEEDAPNMDVSSAPDWLYNTSSYWTISPKLYSNDDGKKVWYLNKDSKILTDAEVSSSFALRPVIEIRKDFVLIHEPSS